MPTNVHPFWRALLSCRGEFFLDWLPGTRCSDLIWALRSPMSSVLSQDSLLKTFLWRTIFLNSGAALLFLLLPLLLTSHYIEPCQSPGPNLDLPKLGLPPFFASPDGVSKFKARLPGPSCGLRAPAGAAKLLSNISGALCVPVTWLLLLRKQVLWHPRTQQSLDSGVLPEA